MKLPAMYLNFPSDYFFSSTYYLFVRGSHEYKGWHQSSHYHIPKIKTPHQAQVEWGVFV